MAQLHRAVTHQHRGLTQAACLHDAQSVKGNDCLLCQCVDTHSQGSPARTSAADDSRPCLQGAQQVRSAIACTEAQRWQRGRRQTPMSFSSPLADVGGDSSRIFLCLEFTYGTLAE